MELKLCPLCNRDMLHWQRGSSEFAGISFSTDECSTNLTFYIVIQLLNVLGDLFKVSQPMARQNVIALRRKHHNAKGMGLMWL